MNKTEGPFRKCLAAFIWEQKKYHTNKEIKDFMIYSFCRGWTALSDEMDNVFEKYNEIKTKNGKMFDVT